MKTTETTNATKIKKRPDGIDTSRYQGLVNWSYKKWAWEFLRRNSDFISECKRVRNSTCEEKNEVALKFGLRKFKDFNEGYSSGSGQPQFSIGSIKSWSNIDSDKGASTSLNIKLSPGQMLIKFNLNDILEDKKAYAKQLRLAENLIKNKLSVYAESLNKKEIEHKPQPSKYGLYIRILDYLAHKKTYVECAQLIHSERLKDLAKEDLHELVSNHIKAARKLAKTGYLYLSLLSGKPNVDKIPLQKY